MDRPAIKSAPILMLDGEPSSVRLLEKLLEVSDFTNVISTTDSTGFIELCAEADPDLIVLGLNVSDPDGFELLGMLSPWIHGSTRLPVVVTAAHVNPEIKRRALSAGAREVLAKPLDPSEVVTRIESLLELRLLRVDLCLQNKALEAQVRECMSELEQVGLELLAPLAFAAEYRDPDPHEHSLRVGRTSALLARELGLPDQVTAVMDRAARLHDIGNIGLSDAVLLNSGRYSPEDFELMKDHVLIGAEILARGRSLLLRTAAEIARTHHERWDGSGYLEGLRGEQIPMSGRIVAVADTFDALTRRRPYRVAMPLSEALTEIRRLGGRDFDPRVVSAFGSLDHEPLIATVEERQPDR